jgi:hypothetical protein
MGKAEAHVEKYLWNRVKTLGGMCLKFTSAISGVPDRIVILAGKTVFVETKALGGQPSALQRIQIGRMRRAGADVRVIDTRGQVDELITELLDAPVASEEDQAA